MRRVVHLEPLLGRHLVGADDRPHLVVEHLCGRAGQRAEPEVAEPLEVRAEVEPERRGALPDLERREGVHVDLGRGALHGLDHARVVVARERRMDPALEADLGRAALPGLADAPHDLLVGHEVRRPAEVLGELPLREGAEPAAEVADVRVLDVPRDDVASPRRRTPRAAARRRPRAPARARLPGPRRAARARPRRARRRRARAVRDRARRRRAPRPARRAPSGPRARGRARRRRAGWPARPPGRPTGRGRRRARGRAGAAGPARARGSARVAQPLDVGPRRLGVDVIDGDGRDAAPVVDPRVEQERESRRRRGSAAPARGRRGRARSARPRPTRGAPRATRRGAPPSACPAWRGSSGRSPRGGGRAPRRASEREQRVDPLLRASRRSRPGSRS